MSVASSTLDQSIVCFGDRIILASATYLGFLHSQQLRGDGSPPKLVVHASPATLKQIEDQKVGAPVGSPLVSALKLDMMETAVLEMMKPSQASSASLVYGQRVKLRHVYSDLVIALPPGAGELHLEERIDHRSHQLFRILPKYSKIRVEGEYVRDCDQVIFQHVDTGYILTAVCADGIITLQVPKRHTPFSRDMRLEEEMWTLHIFHKELPVQGQLHKHDAPEEPKPIKVGSIVSIQHVESDKFISFKPAGMDRPCWIPPLPVSLPTWDHAPRHAVEKFFVEERCDAAMEFPSYSSLWVIESSEVSKGGLVTLHKQHSKDPAFYFRIRHLQSGRYLAATERDGNVVLATMPYHKSRVVRFLPDSRYGDCGNTVIGGHTLVRVVFDTPKKVFLHVRKNSDITLSSAMIYDDLFVVRPVNECGYYYGDIDAASHSLRSFTSLYPELNEHDYDDIEHKVDEWCKVLKGVRDRTQKAISSVETTREVDVMHRHCLLLDCDIHTLCFVSLLWCKTIEEDTSFDDISFLFPTKVMEIRRHCYSILTQLCFRPHKPKLRGSPAAEALAEWIPFMCYLMGQEGEDPNGLKLMMNILKDRPEVVQSVTQKQTELSVRNLIPIEASKHYDTRRLAFLSCLCVCSGKGFVHHQEFICKLLEESQHPLLFPTQWSNGMIKVKPHKQEWTTLNALVEDPIHTKAVAYLAATRELLFALAYKNNACASFVRRSVGTDEMLEGVVLCEKERDFDIDTSGSDTYDSSDSEDTFGCFKKQEYLTHTYLDPLRSSYVRLGRAAYIDEAPEPPRYRRRQAVIAPGSSLECSPVLAPQTEKSPEVAQCMTDLLNAIPLLRSMAGVSLESVVSKIIEHAAPTYFASGLVVDDRDEGSCLWLIIKGEVTIFDSGTKRGRKITAPLVFGERSMITVPGDPDAGREVCRAVTPIEAFKMPFSAVFKILQECASDDTKNAVECTDLPEGDPVSSDVWPWHRFVLVRGLMCALENFLSANTKLMAKNAARNVLLTEWLQLLSSFLELGQYSKTAYDMLRLAKMLPQLASILDLETDDTTTDGRDNNAVYYPHPLADNPVRDLAESMHTNRTQSVSTRLDLSKIERWSLVRTRMIGSNSRMQSTLRLGPPLSPRSSQRAGSPRGGQRGSLASVGPGSLGHGSPQASPRPTSLNPRESKTFEMIETEKPPIEHSIMTGVKLQVCRIFVKLLEMNDGVAISTAVTEPELVEKLKAIMLDIMRLKASRELFVTSFRLYLVLNRISTSEEIPQRLVDLLREDLVNTDHWRLMKTGTTERESPPDDTDNRDTMLSRVVDHCTSFNHCGIPGSSVSNEEESEVITASLQCLERVLISESPSDRYGTLSERQNVMNSLGAIEIVINTVDTSAKTDRQEEVVKRGLDFAISLLEGGNNAVQDGLKQYFFSRSDETLFLVLRDRITNAISTIEHGVDSASDGDDINCLSPDFSGPLFHIEETMRFLQLCCEGHNTALQNYFRVQEDNVQSHDLVSETLKFLTSLFSIATVRDVMSEFCLQVGIQTWRTLTEFCQGPVPGNQHALIEGGIGEDINHMFQLQLDSEGLVVEAQNEAIVCLLSVIEGCTKPNAPLILRDALETQHLLKSLEGIDDNDREEVELGFNIYLLLSFLRDYDRYDSLDFASKLNPSLQSGRLAEALEFYRLRTARVEIMRETGIESVYFRKPSVSLLLSRRSRKQVMEHISWDTRQSRLVDFFDRVEQTVYELNLIGLTQQSPNLRLRNAVHKWSSSTRWSGHVLVLICNMLLFFYQHNEESVVSWVLMLLTLALMALVCISFLEFVWFEGPVLTFAKDKEKKRQQGKYSVADYINRSPSIDTAVDNTRWQEMVNTSLTAVIKESWAEPPFLRLMLAGTACVMSLAATPFFLSILLIPLITESPVIRHVFRAVTRNGKSLFLTMVFGIILMYLFAVVGYMLFSDMFEQKDACSSMSSCFAYIVNYGLRAGGGVGDLIAAPGWGSQFYGVRVTYDMLFYIIINVILMNIVFGIIVDTFGELRQQREKTELEMRTSCFICDVVYSEFDKRADGFTNHIARDHNLWDYMFFVFYLAIKTREDLTGQESYVFNCLTKNDFKFVPFKTSLCFEQQTFSSESNEKPEGEKSEEGFKDFEGFEMLGNKLDAIEKVSAQCKALEENFSTLARDVRQGLSKINKFGHEDPFPRQDTQAMYGSFSPTTPIDEMPPSAHLLPRNFVKPSSSSPPAAPFATDFTNLSFGHQPVHSGFNHSFIGGFPELMIVESPDDSLKQREATPDKWEKASIAATLCALASCIAAVRCRGPVATPRLHRPGMHLEPLLVIEPPSVPGSINGTPIEFSLHKAPSLSSLPRLPLPKVEIEDVSSVDSASQRSLHGNWKEDRSSLRNSLSVPSSSPREAPTPPTVTESQKRLIDHAEAEAARAAAALEQIKTDLNNSVAAKMKNIKEIDARKHETDMKFDTILEELRSLRSQKPLRITGPPSDCKIVHALPEPPAPSHKAQRATFDYSNRHMDVHKWGARTAHMPSPDIEVSTYPRYQRRLPTTPYTPQSPQSPTSNPISCLLSNGRVKGVDKAKIRTDRNVQ
eukprot:TRINITY_DN13824_c0_g1_i1.p1 TRINITY_DN13824_c0_g1~~TRINITY_DN13824_c0_g1_i1.p1  ORF type:complete len:2576 (+),score=612.53 TRINITY_DN13824_c0_g1_i1:62-7789(+)